MGTLLSAPETEEVELAWLKTCELVVVQSLAEVHDMVQALLAADTICFDTETTGLRVIDDSVVALQFCGDGQKAYFIATGMLDPQFKNLPMSEVVRLCQPLWEKGVVGHNLGFDWKMMVQLGADFNIVADTLLMSKLYDVYASAALKDLAKAHLGLDEVMTYKSLFPHKVKKDQRRFDVVAYDKAVPYACQDVIAGWRLYQFFKPHLDATHFIYQLEHDCIKPLARMELLGVRLDQEQILAARVEAEKMMARQLAFIEQAAGRPVALSKPRDVSALLYDELKLPVLKSSEKTKAPSTDAGTLLRLQGKHPVVDAILAYRRAEKIKVGFLDPLPEFVQKDGCIHTQYNQYGAVSGRLSSSAPNLQQVPKEREKSKDDDILRKAVRSSFLPPTGYAGFLDCDWNQIEYRLFASLSGDRGLLQAFENGIDVHVQTAAVMFGKTIEEVEADKNLRQKGKSLNFCVPLSTKILTKRGWLSHDEVRVGDETIGFSADGSHTHWTPITAVIHPGKQELVKLSTGRKFEAVCTPDHRWYGDRRVQQNNERSYKWSSWKLSEMDSEHRIWLSAPAKTADTSGLTPDECAIIAWLYTDGYMRWSPIHGRTSQGKDGRRRGVYASILQAKPKYVAVIHDLLSRAGFGFKEHIAKKMDNQKHPNSHFILKAAEVRALWDRASLHAESLEALVLRMGSAQRHAFMEAAMQAEGSLARGNGIWYAFAQNEGPVLEAVRTAMFLEGHFPVSSKRRSYTGKMFHAVRFNDPIQTGQRLRRTPLPAEEVWCVETKAGSWTMRQGDQIMVTGNCAIYGGSKFKIAEMVGCTVDEAEQLLTDYWKTLSTAAAYVEKIKARARGTGYTETFFGRRRAVPGINSLDRKERSAAEREAVNTAIQGTAADLVKMAIVRTDKALTAQGLKSRLVLTVHDELVIAHHPDDTLDDVANVVQWAMEISMPTWCEMTSKPDYGPNWNDVEPFTYPNCRLEGETAPMPLAVPQTDSIMTLSPPLTEDDSITLRITPELEPELPRIAQAFAERPGQTTLFIQVGADRFKARQGVTIDRALLFQLRAEKLPYEISKALEARLIRSG